jgi:hypothetical protein
MADCTNLGLKVALHIWSSGEKLDTYCLYGISSVAIGRAAKVITFLAAIPILIDIIGERRISLTQLSISHLLNERRGQLNNILIDSQLLRRLLPTSLISNFYRRSLYIIVAPLIAAIFTIFLYNIWLNTIQIL